MEVKKYLEADITAAVDKIRAELGRDAYILSTRNIRRRGFRGFFSKPIIEVIAAYEPPQRTRAAGRGAQNPGELSQEDVQRIDTFFSAAERGAAMGAPAHLSRNAEVSLHPAEPLVPQPYHPALAAYGAVRKPETRGDEFHPIDNENGFFRTVSSPSAPSAPEDGRDGHLRKLSEQIETLSQAIAGLTARSAKGTLHSGLRPEITALLTPLQENEVHEEFIAKIADELTTVVDRQEADPSEVLEQLIRQHLGDSAPLKLRRFKRTVAILVGPTGVGKTTTLAKLAAIYTLNHHAKVGIITTDTYRMAAVEQLKTYAEIMNLPLSVVYSPDEVADALRAHDDKDLVLIDTAGRSPTDPAMEPEIADYVRKSDADEVFLCVSASTGFSACLNLIRIYSFLKDYRILVTKLDETPIWGGLLNLRFLSQRPISYTALGQNVPDDIEVFDPRKAAAHLLGRGDGS